MAQRETTTAGESSSLLANGNGSHAASRNYGTTEEPGASAAMRTRRGGFIDRLKSMLLPELNALPSYSYRHDRRARPQVHPVSHNPQHKVPPNLNLPPKVKIPTSFEAPIRVEAKVWFANERTWLAWTKVALVMGTFSLALYNSGDDVGRIAGMTYAVVSLVVMLYGLYLYQRRMNMIKAKHPGHFDDLLGPVVICTLMFGAITLNYVLKVKQAMRDGLDV